MKRCIKKLCTFTGRLYRDIERKISGDLELESYFKPLIELAKKICFQSMNKIPSSEYIYSLHEQHVECISKGKAHKKYEFGNKVSIAITDKSKVIIGCTLFRNNPHDSKTLDTVVKEIERTSETKVELIGVDLGYRGSKVKEAIHIRLKKLLKSEKKFIRSHPKIEAVISHLERKFHLGRSRLKGLIGDKINCMLSSAAYNFAIVMRKKFT
jgi:transposase, IS5 family